MKSTIVVSIALLIICVYGTTANSDQSTIVLNSNPALEEVDQFIQRNSVTLFSKTFCPFSKEVKKILAPYKIQNIKIVELNLREDAKIVQAKLEKISKIRTVPQLYVNGKFIGNFDTVNKLEKEGKLRQILAEAQVI